MCGLTMFHATLSFALAKRRNSNHFKGVSFFLIEPEMTQFSNASLNGFRYRASGDGSGSANGASFAS